jgi:peptide-methionine (R)-S-oxide reductase
MKRRTLLELGLAAPVLLVASRAGRCARTAGEVSVEALQQQWRDFLPADFHAPNAADKVEHTAEEWRTLLSAAQFSVLREQGTERPFTSPLNEEKRRGVFACAGCDLPLFTSAMKFESGTGWPSFFTTIPAVFTTQTDWKIVVPRTEYHCVRCGGHHGHVFDDGPPPTDQRWCNNGVALRFIPAAGA